MASRAPSLRSRPRVAVILEEDGETSAGLRAMLVENGFTVLIAAEEEATFRLCHEHAPVDLLFTNLMVHGRNVLDLVRSMKTQWPNLKVIAVTEYAAGVISHANGIHDVIPVLRKPLDKAAVASAIGPRLWPLQPHDHTGRQTDRPHLRLVK